MMGSGCGGVLAAVNVGGATTSTSRYPFVSSIGVAGAGVVDLGDAVASLGERIASTFDRSA